MTSQALSALVLVALVAGPAGADSWDSGTGNDNGPATANRLSHGSLQVHDLGAQPGPLADEDWYTLSQAAFTSHEVLLEAQSLAIVPTSGNTDPLLQMVDSAGNVLQQSVGTDYAGTNRSPSRVLTVANGTQFEAPRLLRVVSASCTTTCTPLSGYTVRARETTLTVPRFNNSATQVTVLVLVNPLPAVAGTVTGDLWFWSATGAPLATLPVSLPARSSLVLNTTTVPGVNGASGSITFTHNAPYGVLAGKAVALEAATGFTFDTPLVHRAD